MRFNNRLTNTVNNSNWSIVETYTFTWSVVQIDILIRHRPAWLVDAILTEYKEVLLFLDRPRGCQRQFEFQRWSKLTSPRNKGKPYSLICVLWVNGTMQCNIHTMQ